MSDDHEHFRVGRVDKTAASISAHGPRCAESVHHVCGCVYIFFLTAGCFAGSDLFFNAQQRTSAEDLGQRMSGQRARSRCSADCQAAAYSTTSLPSCLLRQIPHRGWKDLTFMRCHQHPGLFWKTLAHLAHTLADPEAIAGKSGPALLNCLEAKENTNRTWGTVSHWTLRREN